MGFFNKSYAEKMTSDSEEFIKQDGRLATPSCTRFRAKRIMSASNSLEPRVTEQLNIILDNLQKPRPADRRREDRDVRECRRQGLRHAAARRHRLV